MERESEARDRATAAAETDAAAGWRWNRVYAGSTSASGAVDWAAVVVFPIVR